MDLDTYIKLNHNWCINHIDNVVGFRFKTWRYGLGLIGTIMFLSSFILIFNKSTLSIPFFLIGGLYVFLYSLTEIKEREYYILDEYRIKYYDEWKKYLKILELK